MVGQRIIARIKRFLHLDADYSVKPWGLGWRSNTFFIISTVAIGLFTDLFLYGLVVPILPYMLQDRVGIPKESVQGYTSGLLAAYAGASVLFSPVAGIIADKTSTRQLPFLLGLTALLIATIGLFIGRSIAVLTIARILQGVSAAVVWTIGLALSLETVGPENLGKTIGSIFSFISVGNLAAPVLGGVLYKKTGYPGVFGIGFAILALDFIMRLLVIEKKVAIRYEKHDANVHDAEADEAQNHENGNEDADEESPLLSNKKERDYYHIPLDQPRIVKAVPILACMRDPGLLAALLVAFVQATLLSTFDSTVPTEAEDLFDFDSLKSGLLFLPLGIFDLILGPLAGWAVDRYGTKLGAVVGYGYLVPVLVLLRLPHAGGKSQMLLYGGLLGLCGIGLAIIGAPSIVEAGAVVERYFKVNPEFFGEDGPYAQLYGINSMVFSGGLALGPVIAGGFKQTIGYGNMNAVLAAICFVTAVLCFFFIGGEVKKPRWFRKR